MDGFKPKKFDVAGAHPDEAFGAMSDVVNAVKEIRKQGVEFKEFPAANDTIDRWLKNRPLRHAENLDADVQGYLAQGVRIMDGLKRTTPLGFSKSQQEVRDRCDNLAQSMEKVLTRRTANSPQAKSWNYVKITTTPVAVRQPGQTAVAPEKTAETVKTLLKAHFGSAPKAGMAQRAYWGWAKTAEVEAGKTGMYPPMPEGARSWDMFMKRADEARLRSALKGEHWAHVDVNEGIDFAQVMNFRATYRQRPRMRM